MVFRIKNKNVMEKQIIKKNNDVKDILRKLWLSRNGEVASQMQRYGMVYRKNLGVPISRIREIASDYAPSSETAEQLWALHEREPMLMALLLQPINNFTWEMAQSWAQDCGNIEIIEFACMHLFSKLSFAEKLCCEWCASEKEQFQMMGFILSARNYQHFSDEDRNLIIEKAFENSTTDNFHLYKAISLALCRFCRNGKSIADFILEKMSNFLLQPTAGQQYIMEEVKSEMNFLELL